MRETVRRYPEIWISLLILAFVAYVFVDGIGAVFRYKLFPYFVASAILVLMIIEWTRIILTRPVLRQQNLPPLEIKTDESAVGDESAVDLRGRTRRLLVWMAALFGGTILIGINYSAPIFLSSFLLFEAKLKWWQALLIAAASWTVIKFLFIDFLGLQLPIPLLINQL